MPLEDSFGMGATKGTILLVDDDEGVRDSYCRVIKDYNVIACENSQEALEMIDGGLVFDVAVVDLLLSEKTDGYRSLPSVKNGYDLVKEIKKRDEKKPIIVMSGYDEPPPELHQFSLEYPSGREGITYIVKGSINLENLLNRFTTHQRNETL